MAAFLELRRLLVGYSKLLMKVWPLRVYNTNVVPP
jgi:hypothetical protein